MRLKRLEITFFLLAMFSLGFATTKASDYTFAQGKTEEKSMTLDEVCQMAVQNSKHLKVAQAGVETASAAVKMAKTAYTPEVKLSASASYIGNGYITDRNWGNGQTVEMPHFGNNFSFEATQVLFAGGAILKSVEKATLEEQLAQLSLTKGESDIRFLVTGYYLELYKLNNQKEVFHKNIEQTEVLIDQVKSREKEGMALQSDVTRHELRLQNLRLALIELNNAYNIINYQLVQTLDLPENTLIKPVSSVLETDFSMLDETNLMNTALENRTELKIASKEKEIASKEVRLAKSDYYPSIALFANNHYDGPIMIEVPVINNNFDYWMVGVGINYNLSSLYRTPRKVQLARSAMNLAEEKEALQLENARNAVFAAYTKYKEAYEKLSVHETSLTLAEENYRIINNRYLNDLVLITEMLDASTTKLNAELEVVNARIDIVYKYYALLRELGINNK